MINMTTFVNEIYIIITFRQRANLNEYYYKYILYRKYTKNILKLA